jgi:hypothetical protein
MTLFVLSGLTSDDKVPGHYADNRYGQGQSSAARPWYVVCTGNKLASGTMTADLDVEMVYSEAEVDEKVGAHSECAQQAKEALAAGAAVVLAPVAEAGGAVSATLVLNCEALGTGTGQLTLMLGDKTVSWVVDTASQQNTMNAAAAAINAEADLFCVATVGGATQYDVTITVSSAGIRGNDWLAKLDTSEAPTNSLFTLGTDSDPDAIKTSIATAVGAASYNGVSLNGVIGAAAISPPRQATVTSTAAVGAYTNGSTVTFTGLDSSGAALVEAVTITGTGGGQTLITSGYFASISQIDIQAQAAATGAFEFGVFSQAEQTASGFVHFVGGSGADNCSNVINLLEAGEYRRIAAAQNDATNAARWEAHADSESSPLIAHLEQVVFGHNGTSAAAISLAQTTLNAYLCSVYAQRNSRKHPCQIAARVAATRAVYESVEPNTRADGKWNDMGAKLWTDVPAHALDVWSHAELKALLNAGVSPINDFAGDTRIVRSICSHSLNGTAPDYRCLDTADVTVAQYIRDEVADLAQTVCEQNPYVGPDLPDGLPQISGVSTPKIWNGQVQALLEEEQAAGRVTDVATNPPISEYNTTTLAIETIVPVKRRQHQHQHLASIRQMGA